jgi:hypothetical protein
MEFQEGEPVEYQEGEPHSALYLAILFRDRPALGFSSRSLWPEFSLEGKKFSNPIRCKFTGFYDSVRDADDTYVGISCFSLGSLDELGPMLVPFLARLKQLPYVDVWDDRVIKILLSDRFRPEQLKENGDQEFDESAVYWSEDGEFAMSFGTDLVTREELRPELLPGTDFVEIDEP